MEKETLLSYLKRDNPRLWKFKNASDSKTLTKSGNWRAPAIIEQWDEFNFDTLRRMSEGLLYTVLEQPLSKDLPLFSPLPLMFRTISDEDSLDSLLVKWTQSVVCEALSMMHEQHPELNDFHVRMARGGQASGLNAIPRRLRPDWAGVRLRSCDDNDPDLQLPNVVLPGETKLSRKWKSGEIKWGKTTESQKDDPWMLPLLQIFKYCINANTRYGFLITDEELVLVRTGPSSQSRTDGIQRHRPDEKTKAAGFLQCKVVKWDPKDSDGLSINLALWWIHLLAAHESRIAFSYRPLDEKMTFSRPNISSSGDVYTEEGNDPSVYGTGSPTTVTTGDDQYLNSFDARRDPSMASVTSSEISSAHHGTKRKRDNKSSVEKKRNVKD